MPCANLHHVHFSFALPEVKGWKVTVEATRDKSFKPELVSAQRPTFCREDLNGQKAIDQHRVRPSWVQNMFVESIQSCWGSMSSCRFKSETLGQQEMRRQQWASTSWISKTNMTQNVVELMQMCASSKVKWVNSCQFYILAPHPLPCEAALPWSIECQPEGSVQEWWTGDRGLGIHIEHRSSWDSWECKMRCRQFFGACHAVGPKPHLAPLLNWTALERTSQEQLWKTEALVLRLFFLTHRTWDRVLSTADSTTEATYKYCYDLHSPAWEATQTLLGCRSYSYYGWYVLRQCAWLPPLKQKSHSEMRVICRLQFWTKKFLLIATEG